MNDNERLVVISRMSSNQKMVIRDLSDEPCVLGCAETVAHRMTRASGARPALTKHCGNGAFVLTTEGHIFKQLIQEQQ